MEIKSAFLAVSTFLYVLSVESSSISFCDGPNKIEKSREQCGSGYNFGNSRPACVCIKGIYRIWTDTCEVADGFANEICTKLTDDKTKSKIIGLKLSNDPQNWNQTGVVCDRKGFGSDVGWGFVSENSKPFSTSSDHIYVLNGEAFSGSNDVICVKPAELPENKKICKYLKRDNKVAWKNDDIEVSVTKSCSGEALKSSACFGVLQSSASECRLTCGSGSGRPKAAPQGKTMQRRISPGKSGQNAGSSSDSFSNISNPADYRQHDNKFLNRKMLIFNVISQIGEGKQENASWTKIPFIYGQPLKTFELFDLMKDILKISCPSRYVNPDWIDMAVDLFYILHKGHVFRYDELVTQEHYEWIKDILTKCWNNLNGTSEAAADIPWTPVLPVPITTGPGSPGGEICVDGGRAQGYCKPAEFIPIGEMSLEGGIVEPSPIDETCDFVKINVSDERANASYHYVPDVAWDIVDFIQVRCFPQFNESYRMFHVLEQAAEKLFTLQIKNLWYYPGWSAKTKSKLLGAGADIQMHNLEVCVESAYHMNGRIPRLVRPPPPKYIRKRRAAASEPQTSMSTTSEAYCVKTQGDFVYPKNC